MTKDGQYKQDFSDRYHQGTKCEYGRAGMTLLELQTLRQMRSQESSRQDVVNRIIEQGWLQPDPAEVTAADLAEAAVEHACAVAEHLVDRRGPEAAPATFFSYTTKNQFDRYVAKTLNTAGRLSPAGDLHHDWFSPQPRQAGYQNPDVKYPEGLDPSKIYGIAKPHRYWPAQQMRYLEAIRLDMVPKSEKAKLKVTPPLQRYAIPWQEFDDVIQDSRTVGEIAVAVAVKTIEKLSTNGLNDEQIAEVVLAGYSPGGPLNEHGNIPQVHEIWRGILDHVEATPSVQRLGDTLRTGVTEKFTSLGYEFKG